MAVGTFRSLALADVIADIGQVRRLIDEGETLTVERKEQIPSDGLGPTVASFANTYGGWLLLGVADSTKKVTGFDPGRGDFQDKVRHWLRAEIDPLPPFAAQALPVDGSVIGIIRVYESADRPHIAVRTGGIYVREPGGKRAVSDHRELLQLAQYGREIEADARRRLDALPYPMQALNIPELWMGPRIAFSEPMSRQLVVRATPMTPSTAFAERALAAATGQFCGDLALEVFPGQPPTDPLQWSRNQSYSQRGFMMMLNHPSAAETSSVLVDAGGVVAVRFEYPKQGPITLRPITSTAPNHLVPLLGAVVRVLQQLDAYGRCICQLIVRGYRGVGVAEDRAGLGTIPDDLLLIGGESLPIPPDETEVVRQADRWAREIARAAGLAAWQS
jgi:hypothetical protein